MRSPQKRISSKMPIKAPRFSDSRLCAPAKRIAAGAAFCANRSEIFESIGGETRGTPKKVTLSRNARLAEKKRLFLSFSFYPKATAADIGIVLAGPWSYDSMVLRSPSRGKRKERESNSDFLEEILKLPRAFVERIVQENCPRCLRSRELKRRQPLLIETKYLSYGKKYYGEWCLSLEKDSQFCR